MTIQKKIREIVLDTETTGLNPDAGDRIVDIGCVELINHVPSGRTYQVYINPERSMSEGASRISGITDDFLANKPLFKDIVDEFLDFVGDAKLIIHNATFDINFLNSELKRLDKPLFKLEDAIDTLDMARKKFPGSPASLDALCKRFEIDTSARVTHGALVDCVLLADVYINLLGGRQSDLLFATNDGNQNTNQINITKKIYPVRDFLPSDDELASHSTFINSLPSTLWNKA